MERDLVSQVRRFNRAVTQRIGALSEEYLARSRPLGASRVLREIGVGGADVRAIRSRLDLDSGYLSRLLRDRKSTRLNSSHPSISYAVFCLKKKNKQQNNKHNQNIII